MTEGIGTVLTKSGPVEGCCGEGKYAGLTFFRGIPYAAPPVGELRWRAPGDPEPWTEVRKCLNYGPMAVQDFGDPDDLVPYNLDFYYDGFPEASEDCLYLNVCTGARAAGENRPVYVWFHGGGLATGYSYEHEFDPSELASKGIVVVSIGQRLNLFGYLVLPQLRNSGDRWQGNYGLQDQLKALEWVRKNIRGFGGDPDNITIGGQSGGTVKCCVMASLPCSPAGIRNLILESGLKWMTVMPSREEAERKGKAYLERIGIDPELSAEELRKIPADRLYDRNAGVPAEMYCDGDLIPCRTVRELFERYLGSRNVLCGTNFGENEPRLSADGAPQAPLLTEEEYREYFRKLLGDKYEKYGFETLCAPPDGRYWETARRLTSLGLCTATRVSFSRSLMLARLFGAQRMEREPAAGTYVYLFSHVLPGREEDRGTARDPEVQLCYHSSELWYTFASLREGVPPVRPWNEQDFLLADRISSYWANFMKAGDPNGDGLPKWPVCGAEMDWMEFADEPLPHNGDGGQLDDMILSHTRDVFGV